MRNGSLLALLLLFSLRFALGADVPPLTIGKITPSDGQPFDRFGHNIAVDGHIAIIAAPFVDGAASDSGAAYLYDLRNSQQTAKLTLPGAAASENFGESVDLFGSLALVGAGGSDGRQVNSGAAYLYDVATGLQRFKLTASDGVTGDQFGTSVALSATLAVVGTYNRPAYVFDPNTGLQLTTLLPTDATDQFGFVNSIAISGERVLVGAQSDDSLGSNVGEAYLFNGRTGQQLLKLQPSDRISGGGFGISVAVNGNRALVASTYAAYLFDLTTSLQIARLTPHNGSTGSFFAMSVALTDSFAMVGAVQSGVAGVVDFYDPETAAFLGETVSPKGVFFDQFGFSVAGSSEYLAIGARADNTHGNQSGAVYSWSVPEPGSSALLLAGLAVTIGRQGRRKQ